MINYNLKTVLFFGFFILSTTYLWCQLTVNGTSLFIDSATHLKIDGDITINKEATLINKGILAVSGNVESYSLNNQMDYLQIFGDLPGKINLLKGNIDHLFLLKSSSVNTYLHGDLLTISNLHFVNNYNFLTLNDTDIDISNLSNFSDVNFFITNGKGLLRRSLSLQPVIFPVGSAFLGYCPISIESISNNGGEFAKVGCIESGFSLNENQSKNPVWQIENNSLIQFSIRWGTNNNLPPDVLDLKQLRLNAWNGTDWVSVGFDTLVGNINAGYLKTRVLLPNEFKFYKLESILKINQSNGIKIDNLEILPSFPNPFSNGTSVNFKLSQESFLTVQLFSPNGQLIKAFKNRYSDGYHFEPLPENLFPVSGFYSLRFIIGDEVAQTKLLKINY
jgi:hypothetical protein